MAAPATVFLPHSKSTSPASSHAQPRVPHLFKWLKHRVHSKKENATKLGNIASKSTDRNENIFSPDVNCKNNVLSNGSKETIQSSESTLTDSTQDSLDTSATSYSGNTIMSDSSDPEREINSNSQLISQHKNIAESSKSKCSVSAPANNVGHARSHSQTLHIVNSGNSIPSHQLGICDSGDTTASHLTSTCAHGAVNQTCRMCMQLPPLPAGSERVLKEIQRQAKERLRSQSQVISHSEGCNLEHLNIHNTLHTKPTAPAANKADLVNVEHSHYGFLDSKHHRNVVLCRSLRNAATSPEHLYEEIPYSFFHDSAIINKNSKSTSNGSTVKILNNLFKSRLNGCISNSKSNCSSPADYVHNQVPHQVSLSNHEQTQLLSKQVIPNANLSTSVNSSNSAINSHNAMQLKSHEFYPHNMHCHNKQEESAPKQQVSLGNLDFGKAKECDGFLLVPLRDRHASGNQMQSNHHQKLNHEKYLQSQHQANKFERKIRDDFINKWDKVNNNNINQPCSIVNQEINRSVINYHINNSNVTSAQAQLLQTHKTVVPNTNMQTYNKALENSLQLQYGGSSLELRQLNTTKANQNREVENQFGLSHIRTHSVDVVSHEPTEKFSHCKKCNRPHPLYHGVSVCHSEVEDMTQELQYLDIAGLEKDKLKNASSAFFASNSLLQNFATRRSAFSKYIPSTLSSQLEAASNETNNCASTSLDNAELDIYTRQSMSAESDYFSSNYNTSQSDNVSRTSHDHIVNTQVHNRNSANTTNYMTGSDKSNDTFSEYDVKSETMYNTKVGDMSTSTEYDYYLAKVRDNLRIKQEVKQIIKSSESERSDCDNFIQDDSISLTSVTSLSELSTLPFEDSSSFVRSKLHGNKMNKINTKQIDAKPQYSESVPSDLYVSKMQRVRKPIRKKRKQPPNGKDVEYYKLPNFTTQTIYQQPGIESLKANTQSKTSHKTKTNTSIHSDSDKKSIYSLDTNSVANDKLSCRVTNFRLNDTAPVVHAGNKPIARVSSVRAVSNDDKNGSNERNSVYSSHKQTASNSNNRLLSDLMRMNHDRQLFSLI